MSDIIKKTRNFQEKANLFAEQYLSTIKNYYFLLEEDQQKQSPENKKISSFTKDPNQAKELVLRNFRPKGKRSQSFGRKISPKDISEILRPMLEDLMKSYVAQKKQLTQAGIDPSRTLNEKSKNLFDLVEQTLKIPPLDPKNQESVRVFQNSLQQLYENPVSFIPAKFMNSSLRAYPSDISTDAQAYLLTKGYDSKKDFTKNRLINFLPNLDPSIFAKLLSYYKENSKEVESAERHYRSPAAEAGKTGVRGITTGSPSDSSEEDSSEEPEQQEELDAELARLSSGKAEDDFYNELDRAGAFSPKGEAGKFDINNLASGFRTPEDERKKTSSIFNVLKSKNVLDTYFRDLDHLESVAGGASDVQKLEIASMFLEKILHDPSLSSIVIKAIARNAAVKVMDAKIKEKIDKEYSLLKTPEERKEYITNLKKEFNSTTFEKESKSLVGASRAILSSLITETGRKSETGESRFTLKDPKSLNISDPVQKIVASTVYEKLAPWKIKNIQNKDYSFDDFVGGKVGQVESKIMSTIVNAVKNAQLRKAKEETREKEKLPIASPEEVELAKKKEAERRKNMPRADLYQTKSGKVTGGGTENTPSLKLDPGYFMRNVDPSLAPQVPSVRDLNPKQVAILSTWRKANPQAKPEQIEKIVSVIKKFGKEKEVKQKAPPTSSLTKSESLMSIAIVDLIIEGRDINTKNIKQKLSENHFNTLYCDEDSFNGVLKLCGVERNLTSGIDSDWEVEESEEEQTT